MDKRLIAVSALLGVLGLGAMSVDLGGTRSIHYRLQLSAEYRGAELKSEDIVQEAVIAVSPRLANGWGGTTAKVYGEAPTIALPDGEVVVFALETGATNWGNLLLSYCDIRGDNDYPPHEITRRIQDFSGPCAVTSDQFRRTSVPEAYLTSTSQHVDLTEYDVGRSSGLRLTAITFTRTNAAVTSTIFSKLPWLQELIDANKAGDSMGLGRDRASSEIGASTFWRPPK